MFQLALVLALLVGIVITLASGKLPADILALVVLVVLLLSGVLSPEEAYAGFSKEVIIVLAATFVVSGALRETGAIDILNRCLLSHAPKRHGPALLLFMTVVSAVSAFVSNTTVTAMFVPTADGLARRLGISSSRLYLPLAYAAILGGTVSLIGTSTNLAVSGYLSKALLEPVGFFEIAPVGLALVAGGIGYILVFNKWFMLGGDKDSSDTDSRTYHTQATLGLPCPLVGQSVSKSLLNDFGIRLSGVLRNGAGLETNAVDYFATGDTIMVEATADALVKLESLRGIELGAETKPGIGVKSHTRAEVLVAPHARLLGRSPKEANFEQRASVLLLGLFREGEEIVGKLENVVFEVGDLMLVEGLPVQLSLLRKDWGLTVMGQVDYATYNGRKALLSAGLFVAAICASAFHIVSPSVAFLSAALCCVLTGCLRIARAYESIIWKLLVLIACMSSFGVAMEKTGGAKLLANGLVTILAPLGAISVLAGLTIVTVILAPVLSSAAAALLVLPIAINAAQNIGAHPRPFEIAVMLAPSISLFLPLEPSFLLIYGPGKFRGRDFFQIGLGATVLSTAILILMVQWLWPLYER